MTTPPGAIAAKGGSWNAIMEWYFFAMLQTPPLENLGNNRYADLRPTSLHEHLVAAFDTLER